MARSPSLFRECSRPTMTSCKRLKKMCSWCTRLGEGLVILKDSAVRRITRQNLLREYSVPTWWNSLSRVQLTGQNCLKINKKLLSWPRPWRSLLGIARTSSFSTTSKVARFSNSTSLLLSGLKSRYLRGKKTSLKEQSVLEWACLKEVAKQRSQIAWWVPWPL